MSFLLSPNLDGPVHKTTGYKYPPLDGSIPLCDVYDWHFEHNTDHPFFIYYDSATSQIQSLTYGKIAPAMHNAGQFILNAMGHTESDARPLVAFLAASDSITYGTTILGCQRAGIIPFLISPRNSPAAIAAMLKETKPSILFLSEEPPLNALARASLSILDAGQAISIKPMPRFSDIYLEDPLYTPLPKKEVDHDAPRVMVHSSGSTGFPKVIKWTDKMNLQMCFSPLNGTHDFSGKVVACHSIPIFHTSGLALLSWGYACAVTLAVFPPTTSTSPQVIPSPELTFQHMLACNVDYVLTIPAFYHVWAQDENKVSKLAALTGAIYGAGPLEKAVGDALVSAGVNVYTFYGSSELGGVGTVLPDKLGDDWEYFTIDKRFTAHFEDQGDGTAEFVAIESPICSLNVVNSSVEGKPAYATNDILAQHPTAPGHWKVVGRKDDQIMLSTGEKTNPRPIEDIICNHPLVKSAVVFGRGKFQNGVLIEPTDEAKFDPTDAEKLAQFRKEIWSFVEQANGIAPTHSRLFKEMLLVTFPGRPIPLNPKGTPSRHVVTAAYEAEIEAMYKEVEMSTQPEMMISGDNGTLETVRAVVQRVLKAPVGDRDNLFDVGCDSLQATWIRNTVRRIFTSLKIASDNLIYDHPSITLLTRFIDQPHSTAEPSVESKTQEMVAMVSKYSSSFRTHIPTTGLVSGGEVVLLTGTTGFLGAGILAKLVGDPKVAKVFALNRGSSIATSILERQRSALKERGYSEEIAFSHKVVLLEGSLDEAGIHKVDSRIIDEVKGTVTCIIHNAWQVNFKIPLSSYEKSIGGLRTLVDISLASPLPSPPRVIFISSIGVVRNVAADTLTAEKQLDDPAVAVGSGYSESKWTAEQILYAAGRETSLRPTIVRVGQVAGADNGAWNTTDWFPALIKSSKTIKKFPNTQGIVSWVPLSIAASTIVDLSQSARPIPQTVHLVHPRPCSWQTIVNVVSKRYALEVVPLAQWLEELRGVVRTMTENGTEPDAVQKTLPVAMISDIFQRSNGASGTEAMALPSLDMKEAKTVSTSLASTKKIEDEDVQSWLNYWETTGFL